MLSDLNSLQIYIFFFILNNHLQTLIKFYIQLYADFTYVYKVSFLFHLADGSIYKALLFYELLRGSKFVQCFI